MSNFNNTGEVKEISILDMMNGAIGERTAYELTRIMWENMDTLQQSIPALEGVELQDAVTDLAGIPLHEGARRYYEEQGLLPAQQ